MAAREASPPMDEGSAALTGTDGVLGVAAGDFGTLGGALAPNVGRVTPSPATSGSDAGTGVCAAAGRDSASA
ncbi:MAG: hypothetical protein KGO22_21280 [Gammaproteobacteria bacterium]|nr:hypothetical protein [Gammaproteobacteria bacterium]